jgi:hypothetical protein
MAVHACSPFAENRFVQSAAEVDELLANTLRQAEETGAYTLKREGWDPAFIKRAIGDLRQMLPFGPDKAVEYAKTRGWIRVDKVASKKAGEEVLKPGSLKNELGYAGEQEGYVASVFKVYLESIAGGTKQLADNFLMKVNAGEDATVEGLAFARQMQATSRLGGFMLGWGQSVGRGVRSFGTIKGVNVTGNALYEGITEGAADALGNPGEYADVFKGIAAKLGDANRQQEGIGDLVRLAKRVKFLENPHEISKAALGMEVAGNAWNELFINGLLSSPATFATNLIGTVWVPTRAVLQLGAAEAWGATGLFGSSEAKIVAAEATAALAEMYSAFSDAVKIGWHAARTETSIYQKVSRGIHGEVVNEQLEKAGRAPLKDGVADTITKIGEYVRLPSRALLGTDEFAKHLAIRGEVAARGVRRAAMQGIDLGDKTALQKFLQSEAEAAFDLPQAHLWDKYKVDSEYNLTSGLQADGRTIAQVANEATFQEDNALADKFNALLAKAPVLRPFVPFVRTPLNILKQGVFEGTGMAAIYKGAGIAMHNVNNPTKAVLEIQKELLKDPAETFRIGGQIALTTALGATVYGMAMNSQITGGGPGRWTAGVAGRDAQNAWVAAGNVPYSIKVGNQAISFDRFGEPMAVVLRMFADLGMHSAYMTHADQEEVFAGMTGIMASAMYQASFLQGVEGLVKLFQQDADVARGAAVQNWMATQTPFGGLLAYVDRVTDPYKGAYEGSSFLDVLKVHEDTFGTGIFGKVANRIPGVGTSPQLIDQLTGEPVPVVPGVGPGGLNPFQMAIPVFPRNNRVDDVWQTVFDIKGSYREMSPSSYKLTPKEQQQLNKLMASTQIGGKTLGQRIREFRNRPDVANYLTNRGAAMQGVKYQIEKDMDTMIREHFTLAEQSLASTSNDLMNRIQVSEARSLAASGNDVQSVRQLGQQLDDLYQRARRGY